MFLLFRELSLVIEEKIVPGIWCRLVLSDEDVSVAIYSADMPVPDWKAAGVSSQTFCTTRQSPIPLRIHSAGNLTILKANILCRKKLRASCKVIQLNSSDWKLNRANSATMITSPRKQLEYAR